MTIRPQLLPDNFLRCIKWQDRQLQKLGLTAKEADQKAGLRLEKEIQKLIIQYLDLHEIPNNWSRMDKKKTDKKGWPDIYFVIAGKAYFFEVKRPGVDATDDQKRCHEHLQRHGAKVWVLHSVTEAIDIVRHLREEQNE